MNFKGNIKEKMDSDEEENKKEYDLNTIRETLTKNGYSFLRPIGHGGFSSVFLVFSNQYNLQFVVKVSDYKGARKNKTKESQEFDLNEINNLINLNHPNIIKIYKYFTDEHYLYVVLEYCEGGSLKDLLEKSGKIHLDILFTYCHQILTALKHCHDLQITHNDIKPANVLVDKNNRLKLADFGLSKEFSSENDHIKGKNGEILVKHFGGSRPYMAPELFNSSVYDPFKGDIWSLGVTFYELATGHTPWKTNDLEQMRLQISVGVFSFQNQKLPPSFCQIIHRMLEVSPSKRPNIDWLLEQPIFNPEISKLPNLGKFSSNCSLSSSFSLSSSRFRTCERSNSNPIRSLQKMERKFYLNVFEKVDLSSEMESQTSRKNDNVMHNLHSIRSCCKFAGSLLETHDEKVDNIENVDCVEKIDLNEENLIVPNVNKNENQRVSIGLIAAPRNKGALLTKKMRSSLPLPKTFVVNDK